jgi:hypothetical protein
LGGAEQQAAGEGDDGLELVAGKETIPVTNTHVVYWLSCCAVEEEPEEHLGKTLQQPAFATV